MNGLLSNFETIWIDNKKVYEAFLSFSLRFFGEFVFIYLLFFVILVKLYDWLSLIKVKLVLVVIWTWIMEKWLGD